MPLRSYCVLKGNATNLALDDDSSPHIEIRIDAAGVSYRIAVNVRSAESPHDLLYRKQDPFASPLLDALAALPAGLTDIRGGRPELGLDYVRGNFVQREAMEIAPFQRTGPDNDLREYLEPLVRRGMADTSITFYAFGEPWGPEEGQVDRYFGFLPGRGIHDIHMNQGSRGRFASANGTSQDGALLIHSETDNHWTGIFLAFQSQDWQTDAHGNPLGELPPPGPAPETLRPGISIIAALINPIGSAEEGQESVTLINRTDAAADLAGWRIADGNNREQSLDLTLVAGEARKITLDNREGAPRLRNKGGEIRLVTQDGTVAHLVKYEKHQAAREGWTTVF